MCASANQRAPVLFAFLHRWPLINYHVSLRDFLNLVFIITPILKEDKVVSGFKTPTRAAYSHIEELCGCRSSGLLKQLLLRDAIKQQHNQLQEALNPHSIPGCMLQITESPNSQVTKWLHVLVVKNLHKDQESCGQDSTWDSAARQAQLMPVYAPVRTLFWGIYFSNNTGQTKHKGCVGFSWAESLRCQKTLKQKKRIGPEEGQGIPAAGTLARPRLCTWLIGCGASGACVRCWTGERIPS